METTAAPARGLVRATFALERAAGEARTGTFEVTITTEQPVRLGGGIARAGGAVLDAYLRNPVVLWAHDARVPPIGRALSLDVAPGRGIRATFEFAPAGTHELADLVRRLWEAGFLNAASIGFEPLEMHYEEIERARVPVYDRWELYEFSIVAVPLDPHALRASAPAALDRGLVLEFLKLFRESMAGSHSLKVNG